MEGGPDSLAVPDPSAAAAMPAPPDAEVGVPVMSEFSLTFRPQEAAMLRRNYSRASVILEYGSGGSTVLGAKLGKKIFSVESDKAWADRLSAHLQPYPDARVLHVDVGPTEKWGAPAHPRFHGQFHRYPLAVWDLPDLGEPDVVLIDGRFRLACMAAVLLRARRPTTVLFHDYVRRPEYHRIEALARKQVSVGTMVRFLVTPGAIPPDMLTEVVGWFSDPR
jgi:hypothetical protein